VLFNIQLLQRILLNLRKTESVFFFFASEINKCTIILELQYQNFTHLLTILSTWGQESCQSIRENKV